MNGYFCSMGTSGSVLFWVVCALFVVGYRSSRMSVRIVVVLCLVLCVVLFGIWFLFCGFMVCCFVFVLR